MPLNSTPLATQVWGSVTTVSGKEPVGKHNHGTDTYVRNHNTNAPTAGIVNVRGKAGQEKERTRSRSRSGVHSTTDNTLTTTTSAHSYQLGLPIQRLDSGEA